MRHWRRSSAVDVISAYRWVIFNLQSLLLILSSSIACNILITQSTFFGLDICEWTLLCLASVYIHVAQLSTRNCLSTTWPWSCCWPFSLSEPFRTTHSFELLVHNFPGLILAPAFRVFDLSLKLFLERDEHLLKLHSVGPDCILFGFEISWQVLRDWIELCERNIRKFQISLVFFNYFVKLVDFGNRAFVFLVDFRKPRFWTVLHFAG